MRHAEETQMADVETRRRLHELWATFPKVKCQGACGPGVCGPINATEWERADIYAHFDIAIPVPDPQWLGMWEANARALVEENGRRHYLNCPAFDNRTNECLVYDYRPTICRLWGVGRGEMACMIGCEVTGPRLQHEEIIDYVYQAQVIVGEMSQEDYEFRMKIIRDPRVLPLFRAWGRDKRLKKRALDMMKKVADELEGS